MMLFNKIGNWDIWSYFGSEEPRYFLLLKTLSLFSGIGGFEIAMKAVGGFEVIGQSEINPYCCEVLKRNFPEVPNLGDIRHIRGKDVGDHLIVGGYPCQDLSISGKKSGLLGGTRSELFFELWRIVEEVRPRFIILKNVRNLLAVDFDLILAEIEKSGSKQKKPKDYSSLGSFVVH